MRGLARRDAEIEELKTDRTLKERVARFVFDLLLAETGIVLVVLFLQGFGVSGFHINDTTLNIFLPATILQISAMAVIITKYLFSKK